MSYKGRLNLTLYLVTDENPDFLRGKTLDSTVEEAIKGGVTIVQYRQKHGTSTSRRETASRLLQITRQHNVPLIINDDIETCFAIGADGVHIGQDDVKLGEARSQLGEEVIIGVTVASKHEAQEALDGGADYLGIGTMFATATKTDTKSIIGTRGTHDILETCRTGTKYDTPCVAIGGINASNVQRVHHQSSSHSGNRLNGVAVVSAIMAADHPKQAATSLCQLIQVAHDKFYAASKASNQSPAPLHTILEVVPALIAKHAQSAVLSHNMTNTVVQNFAANVCLATGASPIMSLNGDEAEDLAALEGGLVINMGTITTDTMKAYKSGLLAYNNTGNPIVFDPVGGGATAVRRNAIKELTSAGFFDLIKGNEGEIAAVEGSSSVQQRGVDSGPSTSTAEDRIKRVTLLARRERCVILMTGATDYISDGTRTYSISSGSHWLGKITGSGCALGSVLASYLAMHKEDKLEAALAAMLHYEVAAHRAEILKSGVRGPGTFIPAFLDELYLVGKELANNEPGTTSLFKRMVKAEDVTLRDTTITHS